MILIFITRPQCCNREATSISKRGKGETSYLAKEMSKLFEKNMQAKFYTSMSISDKMGSIIFSTELHGNKDSNNYAISSIENELVKESITAVDWFSEFRGGDTYVDTAKVEKLIKDLEAKGIDIACLFLSRDRAQQWADIISGEHTDRLPDSSAAVINTANPKKVQYYGERLEQEIEKRAMLFDSMCKTLGLPKRNS